MVFSDTFQALSAAFTFGTVFQAAGPAILLFVKGHGKTIFRDGRRLALVLFLLFATLWSQIEFAALLMPTTMSNLCAITVIASTALDQLARVMLEQFLLWSVGHQTKLTKVRLAMQGLLLLRIAAGGVLVGFTRIDYAPTCLARTSQLPVGIVVLGLDGVIFGILLIRAFYLGLVSGMRSAVSSEKEYSRALVLTILGFGVWTGTSVPMILGIPGVILFLRTVLPANGLLAVASVIVGFSIALHVVKEEGLARLTPESRSPPFTNSMQSTRVIFQENLGNTGTPIVPNDYTRGSLFVVNPSATPLPTPLFQGNGKSGDTKGFTKLGEDTTTVMDMGEGAPARLEVPDGNLLQNAPGYRGTNGYFVSTPNQEVLHGALVPPTRPSIIVNTQGSATANQFKRSIFSRTKTPPKPSIRSLGISQPMALIADGTSSQPFPNVPTIDLETAAKMERERRDEAAARYKLMANRPLPPLASRTTNGITKRNGDTTSASLSPRRDEMRRRSPGNGNGFGLTIDEKVILRRAPQRTNTNGLPSNPRVQGGPVAREIGMPKEQTVMRINEIVYDQPGLVNDTDANAAMMYANRPKTSGALSFSEAVGGLKSSGSIIHRSRPYKKADAEKVQLFPTEPSRGLSLRRSKSSTSLLQQSSTSRLQPESPTNLPALPTPPTPAAKLTKLFPNKQSVDPNEKMEFLFPAPPRPANLQNRRSSIPSIPSTPPVPATFVVQTPASAWTKEEEGSRRSSKRTSQSSIESDQSDLVASTVTNSPNRVSEILIDEPYLLNATTYQMNTANNARIVAQPNLLRVSALQSGIDDVRKSQFAEAAFGDESLIDEAIEDWASTDNDIPDIEIFKAIENAQPTFSQRVKILMEEKLNIIASPRPIVQQATSAESIPLILDPEDPHHSLLVDSSANEEIFFLDDGLSPSLSQPAPVRRSWHKRIGDELPTFLGRVNSKSRKMPPPTPLLLNRSARKTTVVVRQAEPSPPIDSPERALLEIQEQLKRFEDSDRGSIGSLLERLPNFSKDLENSQYNDRLRLLEDLEIEIGQQENLRQQMLTDHDRDSMLIATPRQVSYPPGDSQRSSQSVSKLLDRRSRMRSVVPELPKSNKIPPIDNSNNTRASFWQQRLADAQMEYTTKATNPARQGSLNFLSVYKAPAGLNSPTPPESVASSETDSESELGDESNDYVEETQATPKKASPLWQPPIASPKVTRGRLWNQLYRHSVTEASPEPPAKNLRPTQRHNEQSLQIFSADTWSKPTSAEHIRPVVGLWGSKLVRPKSIVTRPITQRPARRSRCATDIVESPVPLPDTRETLGLYQYPWEETSDQPIYQASFNPTLLAELALNSQSGERSRQLESETYFPTFLDEDEDDDTEDDVTDQDSEDEFDESTLWEIATLLKPSDVPSTQSLFLPHAEAQAVVNEYGSDDSDNEEGLAEMTVAETETVQTSTPIQPLEELLGNSYSMGESLQLPSTNLWSPPRTFVEPPASGLFVKPANTISLRNSEATPAAIQMLKTPRKSTVGVLPLRSSTLWTPLENLQQEVVWITRESFNQAAIPQAASPPKGARPTQSSAMWRLPEKTVESSHVGLFDSRASRTSYRTTDAAPAAINMIRKPCKPHVSLDSLDSLTSHKLWRHKREMNAKRNWITESSSTGNSSSALAVSAPVMAITSAKTASTDASTVAALVAPTSAIVDEVTTSPIEETKPVSKYITLQDAQPASKLPLRQSLKPVALNRESRIITSRAIFEAKAPPAEKLPALKYRRATVIKKPVKPTRQAMRQQYRPDGTFQASWDEALLEAESASRIKPKMKKSVLSRFNQHGEEPSVQAKVPKLVKPSALRVAESVVIEKMRGAMPDVRNPKANGTSALVETVTMSTMPEAIQRYDPAVLHPVFFTESFISTGRDIHPAAISHFSAPEVNQRYNAAVLHPVFFTESTSSAVVDIHPAAVGHFSVKATAMSIIPQPLHAIGHSSPKTSALWSSAVKVAESKDTGMWTTKPSNVVDTSDMFSNINDTITRAKSSRSESLSRINSTALFQRTVPSITSNHWLHQTSKAVMRATSAIPAISPNSVPASPVTRTAPAPTPASTDTEPSKPSYSMIWGFPSRNEAAEHKTGLWVQPAKQASSAPDIFSNPMTNRRVTATQQSQLSQLVSASLFVSAKSVLSERHWLHHTSKTTSIAPNPTTLTAIPTVAPTPTTPTITTPRQRATTWQAPWVIPTPLLPSQAFNPNSSSNMWTAAPTFPRSIPLPMLFSTMNAEPVTRGKRADSAVGGIESTLESRELWRLKEKVEGGRIWILGEEV